MPNTLAQKLKIKEGYTLLVLHAPDNFLQQLQPLPHNVTMLEKANEFQQIHWFVLNRTQLGKELNKVLKLLQQGVICWTYYPKTTSKIQTDLTRDKGWETLLAHNELKWISLISFDETWSTFGFRLKTETDEKQETKPKQQREIFNYINTEKKEIRLPDDFARVLKKHTNEAAFFNALSFTNKKEYVEWIVTAKRDETRTRRIKESVERLSKGWKNPANR